MSYLLDSNALLWFRQENTRMPAPVLHMLQDPTKEVYYSVITPWELSIKQAKGKLSLPKHFFTSLPTLGFDCLPITEIHVETLRSLPTLHGDPFDRMLVAQAKTEHLTLITGDKQLAEYPVKTLVIGA